MKRVDLYLRLSDFRNEEALSGREAKLRAKAIELGFEVYRVVIENDMVPGAGDGKLRPATAFKRKKMRTPSGKVELRVDRPGFRSVLDDITSGRAQVMLAEDLDRVCRDPRDLEDLIDACALRRASALSLSGSLNLTDGGKDHEITNARIMLAVKNAESRDKARRVADARERLAGQSFHGGRRPYGYVVAPDTVKYHRTLIIVPEEAAVIRQAADDVLNHNVSLAAIAAELRQRGEPTVTGAKWSAETVKDVLVKPAVAGIDVHTKIEKVEDEETGEQVEREITTEYDAPWDAILDPEIWRRLRDKLNDPARGAHYNGNAPRWLASRIALCGLCDDGTTVKIFGGTKKAPSYRCGNHLRRNAAHIDRYISELVIRRLSQPDVADILKPPSRPDVDEAKLRVEARMLTGRKKRFMEMAALKDLDDEDLKIGLKAIRERLAVINAQLADSDQPDPLAEFRDRPAEAVWKGLSLARQREVVKLLMKVTFLPSRKGSGFDPHSVRVEWLA